jgi:hypothetical protein
MADEVPSDIQKEVFFHELAAKATITDVIITITAGSSQSGFKR